MRSSHRLAGAALVVGALLATAGCSGSSGGTAASSNSPSATSSASSSPAASSARVNFPKATWDAKATGAVTGTMKNPGGGCTILKNNDPGVALNVGMATTVPTKKTAAMVLGVTKPGKSKFGGPGFMSIFGFGDVWNTQNKGGGGTIDIAADGSKGTFDAVMPNNKGGTPLHVVGSFTCGG